MSKCLTQAHCSGKKFKKEKKTARQKDNEYKRRRFRELCTNYFLRQLEKGSYFCVHIFCNL